MGSATSSSSRSTCPTVETPTTVAETAGLRRPNCRAVDDRLTPQSSHSWRHRATRATISGPGGRYWYVGRAVGGLASIPLANGAAFTNPSPRSAARLIRGSADLSSRV